MARDIAANRFFADAVEFRPPHGAFILERDIGKCRALAAMENGIEIFGHVAVSGVRGPFTIPIGVAPTKTELFVPPVLSFRQCGGNVAAENSGSSNARMHLRSGRSNASRRRFEARRRRSAKSF